MLLQKIKPHNQKYIRIYRMRALPQETLFNTNNKDPQHQLELLGDLYDRNDTTIKDLKLQITRLEEQNKIVQHASLDHSLARLKYLEIQIHEGFAEQNLSTDNF